MPGTPLRANDPERVGAYSLTARLGEGGQGVVYLGTGTDGERVAVKLLHARFTGDARMRARFAGELASAKRVAPFCTARILDADVDGDTPYLVTEFIDGPSLREVVDAQGPRSDAALQRLAIGTVTALAAIHEAGIVHRDFKPSNVLLAADGPRVIDFGIARALDATGTLSSTAVGTPSYMSPEQIAGGAVGPPTDVFAWGAAMVFAATGSPPFGQDSIPAVMNRILNQEPGLGMLMGPLRDIVAACLAKDAAARPTAQQVLLRLLRSEGVALPAPGGGPPTTMLEEGAQVAAQPPQAGPSHAAAPQAASPQAHWPPPVPYGPGNLPSPYGPAGDTPPPGGHAMGAPPGPYGSTMPPAPYHPAGDTPPPNPYAATATTGPRRPASGRWLVPASIAAGTALLITAVTVAAMKLGDGGGKDPKTPTGPGRSGGTFRMAMYSPDAIDPSNAALTSDMFVVENLFTGLSVINPDGSIGRALATQVTANADCTQWRFTIRQGTTFSDGQPVDANAFVRGWTRTARSTKGEGYLMSDIQGYADVAGSGRTTFSGVTADGPGTLQVRLTKSDCDFEKRVASPVFAPLPPSAGAPDDAAYNQRPVGNGPFKVDQYTSGSRLTLVPNDRYAFTRPRLGSVDVRFLSDLGPAQSAFDAGQYDWAELPAASVGAARGAHATDGKLVKSAIDGMTYLLPIGDDGAMKTKEARLAVSYALDRRALVSAAFQGMYTPATSIVPPAVPGAYAGGCTACTYDPARAKTLARQAGLGPGSKVTLSLSASGIYTQMATIVQQQLKNALGWDVRLRKLPVTDFYKEQSSKNARDLYTFGWVGDYPSPAAFLDSLLSGDNIQRKSDGSIGGSNYARYHNPAFDSAVNSARATPDAARRTQRFQAAEKIALDDMALIPLYSHTVYRLADTRAFAGVKPDHLGYPTLVTAARR